MNVEIVNEYPFETLEERMRSVPLLSDEEAKPYEDAQIELRTVGTHEINPTIFYLLRDNLETQRNLRQALMTEFGIDTLALDRGYDIQNGQGEVWGLIPPLVEVDTKHVQYVARDDEIDYDRETRIEVPLLADGAHRTWLARQEGLPVNVIHVSDVSERPPFYAHPNSWEDVRIFDEVPDLDEKKMYLMEDPYELYRDVGVLGVGEPRSPEAVN